MFQGRARPSSCFFSGFNQQISVLISLLRENSIGLALLYFLVLFGKDGRVPVMKQMVSGTSDPRGITMDSSHGCRASDTGQFSVQIWQVEDFHAFYDIFLRDHSSVN